MQTDVPAVRDVVLVGGGHSHIQVLKAFGMKPEPGVRLTLISERRDSPYSGMLPGHIAGHYSRDEIHINLDALCAFAGARLVQARVRGICPDDRYLELEERPKVRYDVLSLNSGAVPVSPHAESITVKPISDFLPKWQALETSVAAGDQVVVVGAGAGGVELAMAIRARLGPDVQLALVGQQILPGHNGKARRLVERQLGNTNIRFIPALVGCDEQGGVELPGIGTVASDRVLWVTNVRAPDWLGSSGLSVDEAGFVRVDTKLESTSHPGIFASGDVASLEGQQRPKSGVFAVRAGPVLAENLRRSATGKPLRTFRAQRRHLALIGSSDGRAIASRGNWALQNRLMWLWKEHIDRKFMKKFSELPKMDDPGTELPDVLRAELPDDLMRCGGCGAKLAANPLRRVLTRLPPQQANHVRLGIGDDAAEITNGGASTLLTIDGFRSMVNDPYLFGRIAAHHSLNDIFAMGAIPEAALAFVTVPFMQEALMEEELFQLLSGAVCVLNNHGVQLVGGHSAEGAELSVGLTVTGRAGTRVLEKSGAVAGDHLILTKPIGTGAVLAGAMRGEAQPSSMDAVQQGMDSSNEPAVRVLCESRVHALTDVTGFGLCGHLSEMLRASGVGAEIRLSQVPFYPGARDMVMHSPSSLQSANMLAVEDYELGRGLRFDSAEVALMADPQTSGGLLAAVPGESADECLDKLLQLGFSAADIGVVTQDRRVLVP